MDIPKRILYFAIADGRGHLMRAHLVREAMAQSGIDVDIMTTSASGQNFLKNFGSNARVLEGSYCNSYDSLQNLDMPKTRAAVISYLLNPARFPQHTWQLMLRAKDYDIVINDSFNASLLAASLFRRNIVNVYARNIMRAVQDELRSNLLASSTFRLLHTRARANIETVLYGVEQQNVHNHYQLRPILQVPYNFKDFKSKPKKKQNAVIYLNPLFTDVGFGKTIIESLQHYNIHAVGEGMVAAGAKGWIPRDTRLSDRLAAADLIISAPGMGVSTQAAVYAKRFIALYTHQPEQSQNIREMQGSPRLRVVDVTAGAWSFQFERAIRQLRRVPDSCIDPIQTALAIQQQWNELLLSLV